MHITVNGTQQDWDQIDPDEANKYRHIQRQLAAFDEQVQEDRQVLLNQLSDCVERTRYRYKGWKT